MKSTTSRANTKFENQLGKMCIQDLFNNIKHGRRTRNLFYVARKSMVKINKSLA
jgi:hypothetical protein